MIRLIIMGFGWFGSDLSVIYANQGIEMRAFISLRGGSSSVLHHKRFLVVGIIGGLVRIDVRDLIENSPYVLCMGMKRSIA